MADFMDAFFDRTVPGLQKTLDLTWRRNQAITSNVANAETPQYRAVDLNFAGELERAFRQGQSTSPVVRTDSQHMDLSKNQSAHVVADLSGVTRADGNNVDIDVQMGKLVYNSERYSTAANLVRKKLQMMRTAIRESLR